MNWLEQLLPPALVRALGWTLVHSLWQGAVVALALAGLLLLLRQHRAEVRYRAAGLALVVLLLLAGVTFARYYTAAPPASPAVAGFVAGDEAALQADGIVNEATTTADIPTAAPYAKPLAVASAAPTGLQAWLAYFDNNLPALVATWLLGFLAMTLRLLGGLAYVQRLRRYRVQPLAEEWQQRLQVLAEKAGLKQQIELLESALVRVPVVVGHLRPVVLLPLGTVTGLSTAYLEAILAHELAHVQRRDYLMNLLQSVAETLFFYHPAVWFVTACLRTERENCCDDAAAALVGGNPLTVARALAALAELGTAPEAASRQLALSALGPDGSVLGRIRRLVQRRSAPTFSEGFMAACVVLAGLVVLTSAVALADPRPASGLPKKALALLSAAPDTSRKKPAATTSPEIPDAEVLQETPSAPTQTITEAMMEEGESPDTTLLLEDEGTKRRKRRQQVVIHQDELRRPGTIVIEKDKKGRLTNLTVDGQPVQTGSNGSKKGKKASSQVEVVQLPQHPGAWSTDGMNFNFGLDFNSGKNHQFQFRSPVMSKADAARIRRHVQQEVAAANRAGAFMMPDVQALTETAMGRVDLQGQLQALKATEQGLRNSLAQRNLDEETRDQLEGQLEQLQDQKNRIREQLREDLRQQVERAEERLREQEEAQRDAEEARLDAEEVRLDAEEALRDAEEARRDAEEARMEEAANSGAVSSKKQKELARRLSEVGSRLSAAEQRRDTREAARLREQLRVLGQAMYAASGNTEARRSAASARPRKFDYTYSSHAEADDFLSRALRQDGLIYDPANFQFSLTANSLVVNGKKQPAAVRDKYLRLVEKETGRKLTTGSYVVNRQSSGTTADFRGPERPPLPPLPPAPPAPARAPLPPAPPAPPRLDTDQIRAELRKDGLIGASDKGFQLQLNSSGLVVNGQKQPAAVTEKYRQLLDVPAGKGSRNVQISVNE